MLFTSWAGCAVTRHRWFMLVAMLGCGASERCSRTHWWHVLYVMFNACGVVGCAFSRAATLLFNTMVLVHSMHSGTGQCSLLLPWPAWQCRNKFVAGQVLQHGDMSVLQCQARAYVRHGVWDETGSPIASASCPSISTLPGPGVVRH